MAFVKKDKVVIVNNLGAKVWYDATTFYHGGSTNKVSLGTEGTISKIASRREIKLKLPTGKIWHVHPDEIDYTDQFQSGVRAIPDIVSLPDHPLLALAVKSPIFIVDGKVYGLSENNQEKAFYEEDELFGLWKTRYSLTSLEELVAFDKLAIVRTQSHRKRMGDTYASSNPSFLDKRTILRGEADIAQMIYARVFPYLREDMGDKVTRLLGFEPQDESQKEMSIVNKKLLESIVNEMVNDVELIKHRLATWQWEGPSRTERDKRLDSLFGYQQEKRELTLDKSTLAETFDRKNVGLINNRVYELHEQRQRNRRRVFIDGRELYIGKKGLNIKELDKTYLAKMARIIQFDALEKYFSRERIAEIVQRKSPQVLDIKGKQFYSEENFGFLSEQNKSYVYLEVPAFGIKSQFDNRYYFFKKARIGINVWKKSNQLEYSGSLVMIDNNNHPFVHNAEGSFVQICKGDQSFPTSGETVGEVIAKRLRRGKEILLYGYTSDVYRAPHELRSRCRYCERDHFSQNRINLYQLKQKGVLIIEGGERK